jgi:PIN domain nuclease of toxin-antitoxin system
VRLLLDTHVWIWSQEEIERLGAGTTRALVDPETSLHVSTVSTLEIARLVALGTIELSGTLESWVEETLDSLLCSTLEISHEISAAAYSLPSGLHKDPDDRILVATARLHDLTLLTADERLLDYGGVRTLDARS